MIGRTISHFQILEKLGEGGMGVVYKAHDTLLDRHVALKFLPPDSLSGKNETTRLVLEAKAAAALQHPNICTVHEIGQAEGHTFIAMACLEGQSLQERIASGPLAPDEAVDFTIQVCRGLQEAHAQGVVHRDIKPANIMITDKGQAVIMDFGLAKMSDATRLTRTGTTMGTAGYMAPEQIRGEPVDSRSDIWSTGVLLHEMLTGQTPFVGENPAALMYAVLNTDPEPPAAVRPGLPPGLDAIVARAMARNQDQRYQRISGMADDLQELVADSAAFPAGRRRGRKWIRGRTSAFIAAAAAILVLLVVAGKGILTEREPYDQQIGSLAILPLENLSRDADQDIYADGLTLELISTLGRVGAGSFNVAGRRTVMQYKGSDLPLATIAGELDVDALIEGSVQVAGDEIHITTELIHAKTGHILWTDVFDGQTENILALQRDVALAVARAAGATISPGQDQVRTAAHSVNPEAYQAYLRGVLERIGSREHYQRAVELDSTFAAAWAGISNTYSWEASFDLTPPEEAFPPARAAALKALELEPDLALAHTAMARVHLYQDWDWEAARREHDRALELDPASSEAHLSYAWHLMHAGRFDECLAMTRKAAQLDPLNEYVQVNLGFNLVFTRHFDEAIEHFNDMLDLFPESRWAWAMKMETGWAYGAKEMYEEAVAIYSQLGDSTFCYWGPGHHWSVSREFGRSSRRQEMQDALLVAGQKYEENRNGNWAWLNAYAYVALDQPRQAREWLTKSGAYFQKDIEAGEPGARQWVFRQARLYAWLGDTEPALQWLEKAYEMRAPKVLMLNHLFEFDSIREDPRFKDILNRIWG